MEAALGIVGWSPETFWDSGPLELNAALVGWNRANGAEAGPQPMDREGFEKMKALDAERQANG